MRLGTVIGSVWSTKKCPSLAGLRFLRVRSREETLVAVDLVGAGEGECVLLAFGAAARLEHNAPVDAAVIAILDETEESYVTA